MGKEETMTVFAHLFVYTENTTSKNQEELVIGSESDRKATKRT